MSKSEGKKFNKEMGKVQAEQHLWKLHYMQKYKWNPDLLSEDYAEAVTQQAVWRDNKLRNESWFIVINPDPKKVSNVKEIHEFVDLCLGAQRKCWIYESKLWFEFRNDNIDSIHANIAIGKSQYQPSRVKNEFYNTFKSVVGNKLHVNVQCGPRTEYEKMCDYQFSKGKFDKDKFMLRDLKIELCYMYECKKKDFNKNNWVDY